MNKVEFTRIIDNCIRFGFGVTVCVEATFLEKPEIISNPKENVKGKREYYLDNYDDNMVLKSNPEIRITHITYYHGV